ncbi:hypothetical protein HOC13_02900 [Candidatus Woesearchaeota archaeon]|nr:hypothetical protein [Candidatus Woesearchaeota archaeon]
MIRSILNKKAIAAKMLVTILFAVAVILLTLGYMGYKLYTYFGLGG